jgi:hypothetical protein
MANTPSTNWKNKTVFETSQGRKYEVLGGPWADNHGVMYAMRDLDDNVAVLLSERLIETWTVVNP